MELLVYMKRRGGVTAHLQRQELFYGFFFSAVSFIVIVSPTGLTLISLVEHFDVRVSQPAAVCDLKSVNPTVISFGSRVSSVLGATRPVASKPLSHKPPPQNRVTGEPPQSHAALLLGDVHVSVGGVRVAFL